MKKTKWNYKSVSAAYNTALTLSSSMFVEIGYFSAEPVDLRFLNMATFEVLFGDKRHPR
jgi:hypothetical protein